MKKILIDSGPLIALFDASDMHHSESVNFIKNNKLPLVTTIASITETLHLLDFNRNAQIDFIEWVYRGEENSELFCRNHAIFDDLTTKINLITYETQPILLM